MDINLINKYIKKELSKAEATLVIKELKSNPELFKQFVTLKAIHTASLIKESKNVIDIEKEYTILKARVKRKKQAVYYKAVAAAVILLFIGHTFKDRFINVSQTIVSNNAHDIEIVMSDGSLASLNTHSQITFSDFSNSKERIVNLQGEAYFNVVKNLKKPFIVKTYGVDIKVLGTTFNVKSYKKDDFVTTTLLTGKVQVIKNEKILATLKPNDKLVYNTKTEQFSIETVKEVNTIISWKTGQLVFNATPLNQVAKELERLYNVSINLDIKQLEHYKFTAQFENTTEIKEILELLKITSSLNYSISGNTIKISN